MTIIMSVEMAAQVHAKWNLDGSVLVLMALLALVTNLCVETLCYNLLIRKHVTMEIPLEGMDAQLLARPKQDGLAQELNTQRVFALTTLSVEMESGMALLEKDVTMGT